MDWDHFIGVTLDYILGLDMALHHAELNNRTAYVATDASLLLEGQFQAVSSAFIF
jgi:hypothetical protein